MHDFLIWELFSVKLIIGSYLLFNFPSSVISFDSLVFPSASQPKNQEPVLRHSILDKHSQCQHPFHIRALVWVLLILLTIQLPTNVPGQAAAKLWPMCLGPCHPCGNTRLPKLAWPRPVCCSYLGSELVNEKYLISLCVLPVSIILSSE